MEKFNVAAEFLLYINPPKFIVVLFPNSPQIMIKNQHFFNGAGVDLCVMTAPQQETSPLLNSNSLQSPANPGKIFKFSILGIKKCLPKKIFWTNLTCSFLIKGAKVLKGSMLILLLKLFIYIYFPRFS